VCVCVLLYLTFKEGIVYPALLDEENLKVNLGSYCIGHKQKVKYNIEM
jgi:hypothetical protein